MAQDARLIWGRSSARQRQAERRTSREWRSWCRSTSLIASWCSLSGGLGHAVAKQRALPLGCLRARSPRISPGQLFHGARLGWLNMRVLLRNRPTNLYYGGLDRPGVEHEGAVGFGNVSNATRFTFGEKLPDMEIILHYDSCGAEIGLPVLAEWCLFEERALRLAAEPAPPGGSLSTSPASLP
jgi:hypothetical protein